MVNSLAFSPDGKLLASAAGVLEKGRWVRGDVRVSNASTGETIQTLETDNGGSACVTFSADGKRIAFSVNSLDRTIPSVVEIFDVTTWKSLRTVEFSPGFATSISLLPDGQRLLIAGGDCVPTGGQGCRTTGKVWLANAKTDEPEELVGPWPHGYFRGCALTPAADRFVTGTSVPDQNMLTAAVEMRDIKTGEVVWSHAPVDGFEMNAPVVSPDGKLVGCCSYTTIVVLETGTGTLVHEIKMEE